MSAATSNSNSRPYGIIIGLLLLVLVLGFLIAAGMRTLSQQRVAAIDVDSSFSLLPAQRLAFQLNDLLGEKMLDVDLPAVTAELAELDWVRSVTVRRRWPNRIAVELWEHEVFARWGETETLTRRGEVLAYAPPPKAQGAWPRLVGPVGSAQEVLEAYVQQYEQMQALGETLMGLSKNSFDAWRADLASGSQIHYGRVMHKRQQRVSQIWPVLARSDQAIASLDMRYNNGFAVQWRDKSTKTEAN